jgi:hypothetical protein
VDKLKEIQVFLRGGIGNQLFQYSTGLALSEITGKKLILRSDLLPEYEDSIGGTSRWPNQIDSFYHSGEIRSRSYQPSEKTNLMGKAMQGMRALGDQFPWFCRALGWVASENSLPLLPRDINKVRLINSYVTYKEKAWAHRKRLRTEIRNIKNPSAAFYRMSKEMTSIRPIVLHVRQGDYLGLEHIFGSLPERYYQSALKAIEIEGSSAPFWIFSDAPDQISRSLLKFLNPDRVIGPKEISRPVENLVLMSLGRSLIAANSTFSWWASLISDEDSQVIVPNMRAAKVNNFSRGKEPAHNWLFIDVLEWNADKRSP